MTQRFHAPLAIPRPFSIIMFGHTIPTGPDAESDAVGGITFRVRGFVSFKQLIGAMNADRGVDLVHLGNEIGLSRVHLAEQCRMLAPAMGYHPNKPWLHLSSPELNFVAVLFGRERVIVRTNADRKPSIVDFVQIAKDRLIHK